MTEAVVIVVGLAATIAVVVWFMIGHTPEQTATHEAEPEQRERYAGRSLAGPADAGAESEAVPRSGEPGPDPGNAA